MAAPTDWRWTPTGPGPPEGCWRRIGRFASPDASVDVSWRTLDREVRVEDWLPYECRLLGVSVVGIRQPEGRRVRATLAEIWKPVEGTRRDGFLGLVKQGDRLFRLLAELGSAASPATRSAVRDVLASLQPLGGSDSSCAEDLATWRPALSSSFSVRYPASWLVVGCGESGSGSVLHLRSRLGGRWRGSVLLQVTLGAVPVAEEAGNGMPDGVVAELLRREPECVPVRSPGMEVRPGPGSVPAREIRVGRGQERWECCTRAGHGSRAAWVLVLVTPTEAADPFAWMVNVAALDLVERFLKEEQE